MLTLLICLALGGVFSKDVESITEVITSTMDGALYCPMIGIGKKCPDASIVHYYKCCGDGNTSCCFNLQTWVIIVLAVTAVIVLSSIVLSVLHCLFCRR